MLPGRQLARLCRRHLSAAAAPAAALPAFRTPVGDPREHSQQDVGRLYTVDPEDQKRLFQVTGLRKPLAEQARTFSELSLLVRRPALDVLDCVRGADLTRPARRLVLYGHYGAGKSSTVAHVLHWALASGWLLVHVPEADRWGLRFREVAPAVSDPRLVDHPLDAAQWLAHFRSQNSGRLSAPDLVTGREYTWSRREATPAGAPLGDLVDLGVARVKHASSCVQAVLTELKQHATGGRCKLMVAVEKVNAFWCESAVRREDRSPVAFADFTVVRAVSQLLADDWSGGVVLATVSPVRDRSPDSHLPRHLLGQEGWRALDPFVPVRVDDLSRLEAYNMIDYFCERRWLQAAVSGTEEGKKELFFRSGGNAAKLVEICSRY